MCFVPKCWSTLPNVFDDNIVHSYVMGIGEAEAFSERLKRELLALEAANVHAILESEPLVDEVFHSIIVFWIFFPLIIFIIKSHCHPVRIIKN